MLPLLLLNKSKDSWTLQLFQYNFKTTYSFDYNLAFASFLLSMLPVMVVYVFAQKYIIQGLTTGAVKAECERRLIWKLNIWARPPQKDGRPCSVPVRRVRGRGR